jgi:hypothetical protein
MLRCCCKLTGSRALSQPGLSRSYARADRRKAARLSYLGLFLQEAFGLLPVLCTISRFLRKFGIERQIGDVIAYLNIQEQGTKKFIKKGPGFSVGM